MLWPRAQSLVTRGAATSRALVGPVELAGDRARARSPASSTGPTKARLVAAPRVTSDCARGQSIRGSGAPFRSGQRWLALRLVGLAQGEKAGLRPRPACTRRPSTPPHS